MMRKAGFFLLTALVTACGGSVEQESGTGGSAGVGGVAGFGGGGTGGVAGFGGGGMGGVAGFGGGGMGGIAGAGGGVACGRTYDSLDVKIDPSMGGSVPTCNMKEPTVWQATGRVVKSDQNIFVLDTCPPNADCIAMNTTISVTAKDLQLWLPQNAFVSVKYTMSPAWGDCTTQLSIRNVPSWGGEKSSFSSGTQLFFAGADGQLDNSDAPFVVSKIALGCPIGGTSCGGNPPDDYALVFNVGPGDPGTLVGMGQTTSLMAPEYLQVHNLRSFESGACDDYWNWAWWAAWVPTSTGGK